MLVGWLVCSFIYLFFSQAVRPELKVHVDSSLSGRHWDGHTPFMEVEPKWKDYIKNEVANAQASQYPARHIFDSKDGRLYASLGFHQAIVSKLYDKLMVTKKAFVHEEKE